MIESEAELLRFLDDQGIPYRRIEHPAVFTCEEAERYRPKQAAISTKNLFLSDRDERHFLIMTACEKRLDLKALGNSIQAARLHFGSEDDLAERLGVTRGAVTVLSLVNDALGKVELIVDQEVWQGEAFLCHPLVNTATLILSKADLERFIEITGHSIRVVRMP